MKKITKVLALTLVVVMALAIIACGGKSSDLSGKWTLSKLEVGGEDYMSMLSLFGMEADSMYLELNSDGTCTFAALEQTAEGTWEETSGGVKITVDGDDQEFKLSGGELSIEEDGTVMAFKKN